jgi:hypothetical protein
MNSRDQHRYDRLIAYEISADFVADLRADREANQHNQGENQEGVENTELSGQILGKAADDVQALDAIMNNQYGRQPEKLRAWQSANRVEGAPQREKKPAPGSAGTPAKPQ